MIDMSVGAAQAAVEMAGIATMPGSLNERAEAVLESLHRLTGFDAGYLVLLDTEGRLVVPLARSGYPERVERFFDSPAMFDDLERVGLQRLRPPMQLKDLPVSPWELPAWAEYLYPAGFAEGLGVPLSTSDGRYIGQFGANTAAAAALPDATMVLLGRLAPLIAHTLDPLRTVSAVAALVHDAVAGVILSPTGNPIPLPGLPGHPLLSAGSPVLTTAHTQPRSRVHSVFLCPAGDRHTALLRVTVVTCPPQTPAGPSMVVLLSPPPDVHGLTRRELEVLGLLIDGCTNAHIAAVLTVTARTVASHIEHIMVKLAAASRTMAAVQAERQGLYLPTSLITAPALPDHHSPTPAIGS